MNNNKSKRNCSLVDGCNNVDDDIFSGGIELKTLINPADLRDSSTSALSSAGSSPDRREKGVRQGYPSDGIMSKSLSGPSSPRFRLVQSPTYRKPSRYQDRVYINRRLKERRRRRKKVKPNEVKNGEISRTGKVATGELCSLIKELSAKNPLTIYSSSSDDYFSDIPEEII